MMIHEFQYLKGTNNLWIGYIHEIQVDEIYCILKKDYNLDKELWFPITSLTEQQKGFISLGSIIRFNLTNETIQFLLNDGITWI